MDTQFVIVHDGKAIGPFPSLLALHWWLGASSIKEDGYSVFPLLPVPYGGGV